jgi:hypothetical protein
MPVRATALRLRSFVLALVLVAASAAFVGADRFDFFREEHVTDGRLDLVWEPGFGLSNRMQPLTLAPEHPAYANPSGDHTVALAQSSAAPDSGGIILTAISNEGIPDYLWEAWVFTGDGNSRRGLVVRAQPGNGFASHYQFVVNMGLFQFLFRRLDNSAPVTLRTWFASDFPGGPPAPNTWHKMKVEAVADSFKCYWDDFEVTSIGGGAVHDATYPNGYVGVYNFRFDVGNIPFLTDDLTLTDYIKTPAATTSLGAVKRRWSN